MTDNAKLIRLAGDWIQIQFPFNSAYIEVVRDIPDRRWNGSARCWELPATAWHAKTAVAVMGTLGFKTELPVKQLAQEVGGRRVEAKSYPEGLYQFQREAVEFGVKVGGRFIIADEMGVGKTVEALAFLQVQNVGKTLILSPANVVYKWEAEVKRWLPDRSVQVIASGKDKLDGVDIHIMSYAIAVNQFDSLDTQRYQAIISDECFPKGTPISTPSGNVPIENIRAGDFVLGIDSLGSVCYNRVHHVNKREASKFVIINDRIRVTPNHPIYVEGKGYVEAGKIQKGMRILQHPLLSGAKHSTILYDEMFSIMESTESTPSEPNRPGLWGEDKQGAEKGLREKFGKSYSFFCTPETKQPYAHARSKREDDELYARLLGERGIQEPVRGQRSLYSTADGSAPLSRMAYGSPYSNAQDGQLALCDTGFIARGRKAGRRIRWEQSQQSQAENNRQAQRRCATERGVFYSPYTERSSKSPYLTLVEVTSVVHETAETPEMVYNFETDTGNYFAHVTLVHNCHYLKNPKAARTRTVKALAKRVDYLLFLSGTPFLNRPAELFPILNMIDPKSYGNFYHFAARYCGAFYDGIWVFPPNVITNTNELAERLSSVMIRRTKRDVLKELPELSRSVVPVNIANMSEYRAAYKDVRKWVQENAKVLENPEHALTKLNILRQIVGNGKVKSTVELAEDILEDDEKKVVIFAHHKAVVQQLVDALKVYGLRTITGEISQKDRDIYKQQFQDPTSRVRVMIISTAGAEGIDLYAANDIIFCEREWVPAKEEQAEARLHRIGQKSSVTAYYIVARDTVDQKLDRIVSKKREMIGQVIRQDEILTEILSEF